MIKKFCDRCGKELGKDDFGYADPHISYTKSASIGFQKGWADEEHHYLVCEECINYLTVLFAGWKAAKP